MAQLIDLIDQLKIGCSRSDSFIMEETGLSPAEYNGISVLDRGEKVCAGILSQKMHLSPSRASRVIDQLVRNGYLVREGDSEDRRRCTISLAEKGVRVKKKIEKLKKDCEKKIMASLSADEIQVMSTLLTRINRVLS